jgi:hypothetical protein
MKNNNASNRQKKSAKSKVYTQKKPAKKTNKKKNEISTDTSHINNVNYVPPIYNNNSDTYTTSDAKNTTYISATGKLPETYTASESNTLYSKLDDPVETEVKRSEMLPSNPYNSGNMIIMAVGILAFFTLLLLLVQ